MKKRTAIKAVIVIVLCSIPWLLGGCKLDEPANDAFLEKWQTVEQQSKGHSPPEKMKRNPDIDPKNVYAEEGIESEDELMEKLDVEKPLPKMLVSLEMRRASLVAVLSALAKVGSVSIMISPTVENSQRTVGRSEKAGKKDATREGITKEDSKEELTAATEFVEQLVTLSVSNQAWDEVFLGILRTNGLTYKWEGGIIRVLTLEDLKHEVELIATRAKAMVQKVLLKNAEPRITRIIHLNHMSAARVATLINQVIFHREGSFDKSSTQDSRGFIILTGDAEKTEIEADEPGSGLGDGEGGSKLVYNVEGYVSYDNDTNSIVAQARRDVMKIIYYLVYKLDKPRKQIRIKGYIVETDSGTARELGVRWGGMYQYQHAGNSDKFTFMPGGSSGTVAGYQAAGGGPQTGVQTYNTGTGASGQGFASNFPLSDTALAAGAGQLGFLFGTIGENILEVQLSALETDQKLRILSSPSTLTVENKIATIQDGFDVPFAVIDDSGNTVINWREAVLELTFRPHIIDEQFLRLEIGIKNDFVDFANSVAGNPLIRKKFSATELVARSGETIVLSGLTRRTVEDGENGFPLLKDVPVMGWLFKHETKDHANYEVLVFITPTILPPMTANFEQKSFKQIEKELEEEGLIDTEGFDKKYNDEN